MNRKLHNTASALFASAGLLVLGLIAASPAPGAGTDPAIAVGPGWAQTERIDVAGEAASLAAMAETLDALEATDAPPRHAPTRKARRSRQSVAMPFFSFAPRG